MVMVARGGDNIYLEQNTWPLKLIFMYIETICIIVQLFPGRLLLEKYKTLVLISTSSLAHGSSECH